MRKLSLRTAVLSFAMSLLAACGGGGDDVAATPPPAPAPAPVLSTWSMDSYTYVNGGHSSQSASTIGGRPYTVAAVSTATLTGGDQANGPYSGGVLNFTFYGAEPGTYNVVADRAAWLNADPATRPIYVESQVGIGVQTGSTLYRATAGQVTVTKDPAGVFHFDSVSTLPTAKLLEVLGGVAGAPGTMALSIRNAY